MNLSYRYLDMSVALIELNQVKEGKVVIHEVLDKLDFHLRPFTDQGITKSRLLEVRTEFFKHLGTNSENIEDIAVKERKFDSIFTQHALTMFKDLDPVDGFNPDVWSYITMRLLPDLALWRWKANKTDERFLGGSQRSCFQRLWLRAYVLGEDLASQLQEDEAVNIFERPEALGGNKRVALSIANYIVNNRGVKESGREIISTAIVKQAAKQLRRLISVQVVQTMTDDELNSFIQKTFHNTFKICIEKNQ